MLLFPIFIMIFQDIQHMDETGSWHSVFQNLNIKARSNAGSQKIGKTAENRIYNRYRDVVPYDHSLVRLRNSDTDYINANLVKVASISKEYILTQGPLSNTCKHFWEMIWEQKSYSIVMLNRVVEKNQLKCHQYWPLKDSLTAGDIKVTVIEEEDHKEFIVRYLELEHLKEGSIRHVRHFHYVAWPDFGVPSSPEAFLKYLMTVQQYQSSMQHAGPPVIHCSAGIGRSGTFALIDAALTEITQTDDMMNYDVKAKLLEMRTYRAGLIQTTEQLHFSYIAILEGANMVAPTAYSTAYYSMPDVQEYQETEEEDLERADKRRVDGDEDRAGQPDAKEPRREPIAAVEESSESESGEDEVINLSDIDPLGQAGDENGEAGDKTGAESKKGEKERGEQIKEATNDKFESSGFPDIKVTASSSPTLSDKQKVHEADIEADKGGTVDQTRQKRGIPSKATEQPRRITKHGGGEDEQCVLNEDTSKVSRDGFKSHVTSESSVCSGHFPSDFDIRSSEDVLWEPPSTSEVAGSSQSLEKVVHRWQSSENDETGEGSELQPKRSSMRRNSLESQKRKSVTFVNGEGQDSTSGSERDSAGHVDEKETESSSVHRRTSEERKRNLANKVSEMKKKMKDSEGGNSFTMIGLALCFVVVGVAYFYYYRY